MLRIGKMEPFQPLLWSLSGTANQVAPRIQAQSRRRRHFAGVNNAWMFAELPLKSARHGFAFARFSIRWSRLYPRPR